MLNQLLSKHRNGQKESGVAMMIAVLIILVMVGLITFMTSFAMRSIEKGTSVQNLNASLNAADTAIANMMTIANGEKNFKGLEMEKYVGVNKAVFGSFQANEIDPAKGDGKYAWRWYAEKNAGTSAGTTYTVYATGYKDSPDEKDARTVKVVISSTTVENITYEPNGDIAYLSTHAGSFGFNAFANTLVTMGRNASAKVYDSNRNLGYPSDATSIRKGTIASNKSFNLDVGTSATPVLLSNISSDADFHNVCTGAGCGANDYENYRYMLSLQATRNQALANCPAASYPDWVASQKAGTISGTSIQCYNNIVFDTDTALQASISTGNAVKMYAKGSITVKPGVEVARQVRTSQGPFSLQIVGSGSTNFLMERGTTANPTKFTGTVVGSALNCNIGGDSASTALHGTALYGSLACGSVKVQRDAALWWDLQLEKTLKEGSASAKKIWTAQSYEEI